MRTRPSTLHLALLGAASTGASVIGCGLLAGYDFNGYVAAADAGPGGSTTSTHDGGLDAGCAACPAPPDDCSKAACTQGACSLVPSGAARCFAQGNPTFSCDPAGKCLGAPLWSHTYGVNQTYAIGYGVAVDPVDDGVLVVGSYSGGFPFGSQAAIPPVGTYDGFVAKLDAAGTPLWLRGIGSPSTVRATGVAVDPKSGHVFVAGVAKGGIDRLHLDASMNETIGSNASLGFFLLELDAGGKYQWGCEFDTGTDQNLGSGAPQVAIDGNGNVRMAGTYQGDVNAWPSAHAPAGGGYVATFTPGSCAPLHVVALHDPQYLFHRVGIGGFALDTSSNMIVAGSMTGSAFGDGGCAATVTPGDTELMVARFSGTGTPPPCTWARAYGIKGAMGSPPAQAAEGVAVDPNGEITLTGTVQGPVTVDKVTLDAGAIEQQVTVLHLNGAGDVGWVDFFAGTGLPPRGVAVAVGTHGDAFVGGTFGSSLSIGTIGLAIPPPPPPDAGQVVGTFLARIDAATGAPIWAHAFGDGKPQGVQPFAVATDKEGNVYVTGGFGGTADFGAGPVTIKPGDASVFLAKFAP